MYTCPACGSEDVIGRATCRCGADLTLLLLLESTVNAWFNQGLKALSAGKPGQALEWFSACCAAQPTDAAARLAQAKAWCQLERWTEAQDSLARVRLINPVLSELAEVDEIVSANLRQ